jgi:hypothetical protein
MLPVNTARNTSFVPKKPQMEWTAKYAKPKLGRHLRLPKNRFPQEVNPPVGPTRSPFAYFAYFAVSTAKSRLDGPRAI